MSWLSDPIGTVKAMRQKSAGGGLPQYGVPGNPYNFPGQGPQALGTPQITSPYQSGPPVGGPSPTFPRGVYSANSSGGGGDGGMSDFEKWYLILQGISGVAGGYGAYAQGQQNKETSAADLAERAREFDQTNALSKQSLAEQQRQYNTSNAAGVARQIDTAPLRDRATYMLGNRLGQSQQPFAGAGLTQPGQQGGVDFAQTNQANAAYKPGAGGTNGSTDIMRRMLQNMGYPYYGG